jgi:VWFA-related protein
MRRASLIVLFSVSLLAGLPAKTQTLKVDVLLQEVTSTVTDSDGMLVKDLRPEDFIVEVDGTPQKIEHFTHGDKVPLSLGLVLDTSRSMETSMAALKGAAEAFVTRMYPEDESFIVTFDMNAAVRQGFTHDPQRLLKALQTINVGGSTGLIRGLTQARKKMAQAENPKHAFIVISDGGDSFAGEPEIARFEEQLDGIDVLIYAVQIQDPGEVNTIEKVARRSALTNGVRSTPAAFRPDLARGLMESISTESAGKYFYIDATTVPGLLSRELSSTFEAIFTELRGQYSIGFYPRSDKAASSRVQVRTVNPAFNVRTSAPHSRQNVDTDADPYETALLTAESARRRGETAEALRTLEHATILNRSDPRAFRRLADLWASQGRFQQALETLNKLQSLGPLNGADHLVFGTALMGIGDASDALAHFAQSLKLAPENPKIYLQMYNAYMKLNQPADGLSILDEYLKRFRDDEGHDFAVERANELRPAVRSNGPSQ